MRLLRSLAKTHARFDDPNLVSHSGLVPMMALAERAGLADLVATRTPMMTPIPAHHGLLSILLSRTQKPMTNSPVPPSHSSAADALSPAYSR